MQLILDRLAQLADKMQSTPVIDSYRVFHGRGRCFPGLEFVTVDFFQPVILITLFAEPPESWVEQLIAQAQPLFNP